MISESTRELDCYIEKVHLYERGVLRQVLLVIYKATLFLINLKRDISVMRPISILFDIDKIIQCSMTDELEWESTGPDEEKKESEVDDPFLMLEKQVS